MNSLDLTRWLLKVRDALAEHDEIKRDSMLRAADRSLNGAIKRRSHSAGYESAKQAGERTLGTSSSRNKGSNQTQEIN